jgi:hypothetical protein
VNEILIEIVAITRITMKTCLSFDIFKETFIEDILRQMRPKKDNVFSNNLEHVYLNLFCLFYAYETIVCARLELGLLSIFNQDRCMCMHVREDDKSIIGFVCSASAAETVITITM